MRGIAVTILALLLGGCGNFFYPTGSYDAGPQETVWMVTRISGGQQCEPRISFDPPNVVATLRAAGVEVYDHVERNRATCRACTCPSYSADHYVQVAAGDEEKAEHLRFELSSPPPEDG